MPRLTLEDAREQIQRTKHNNLSLTLHALHATPATSPASHARNSPSTTLVFTSNYQQTPTFTCVLAAARWAA